MSESMFKKLQRYDNLIECLGSDDVPADEMQAALDELTNDIELKAGSCVVVINRMQSHIDAVKAEKKRLQEYQKQLEVAQERLKKSILSAMRKLDKKTILTDTGELKRRKTKDSVVIDDVTKLGNEFVKATIEYKPDKTLIYSAIKGGRNVTGAHLEPNETISIK